MSLLMEFPPFEANFSFLVWINYNWKLYFHILVWGTDKYHNGVQSQIWNKFLSYPFLNYCIKNLSKSKTDALFFSLSLLFFVYSLK